MTYAKDINIFCVSFYDAKRGRHMAVVYKSSSTVFFNCNFPHSTSVEHFS